MNRNEIQRSLTDVVLRKKDTLLHVSIRLGKTKIALDAIEHGEKVLWVYPSEAMVSGYEEDLVKFKPLSTDITFTNISSIKKFKNTTWDFIIVDEPQRCQSAAQLKVLKTISYTKRVGLSGTMNKKTLATLGSELNWTVGAKYTLEDGIRDGIVKDYQVFIHFAELDKTQRTVQFKRFGKEVWGTESEAYDQYCSTMTYFDDARSKAEEDAAKARTDGDIRKAADLKQTAYRASLGYKKYMGLRTNLLYNSKGLLKLGNRIVNDHRNAKALIYALRTDIADSLSTQVYHTKNKNEDVLEEFRISDDGHLAVVDCVTTGITIKNLNTVIFHSYDSNTENFEQKLGRSLLYEHSGECSDVHVCVLKDTQNEKWIDKALSSLAIDKIFYVINGMIYSKIDWIKKQHPDKELFLVNDSQQVIYFKGFNEDRFREYCFLTNPDKGYAFKQHNLTRII